MKPLADSASIGIQFQFSEWDFFLSVLSMMLLAAAGNVINDYFDQKVDRINKPTRVIVGKTVKRRVAMVLHQGLNILAVLIGVYIAWKTKMWMAIVVPVFIATVLWWYSPVLKKLPLAGNLAVALCVALVPIWAAYFEIHLIYDGYRDMLPDPSILYRSLWIATLVYAAYAFLLTLAREAIKDMEDLPGDQAGGYRTLPVLFGTNRVKKYVTALFAVIMISIGWIAFRLFGEHPQFIRIACLLGAMVFVPLLIASAKTIRSVRREQFHSASNWCKLSMGGGVLFGFVLRFIVYG